MNQTKLTAVAALAVRLDRLQRLHEGLHDDHHVRPGVSEQADSALRQVSRQGALQGPERRGARPPPRPT